MRRTYIPIFSFLLLLLLMLIPFSIDHSTSVVPGWHITIYPPYFVWTIILSASLIFIIIAYWLISNRVNKINWTLFIIHFFTTVAAIAYIRFPALFIDVNESSPMEILKDYESRLKLIPVAWIVFLTGQILFLIYFIRTLKYNHIRC